ncbi:hypothetical protein PY32053_04726 (plasmid) [Paracoccus yeei]|uniref:Uncharacterized protein n=1 Tax=Paracoccus yeei TaxID=147645 RepID=A0A386UWU7_9RHOB|nr:hypothetical protein PY32053_04726 [Paracoccus yeei]
MPAGQTLPAVTLPPAPPSLARIRTRSRPFGPQGASRPTAFKNYTARPKGGGSPASWRALPPGAQARPDCAFFACLKIIRRQKNKYMFLFNFLGGGAS